MARLDQERQKELEPKRIDFAVEKLKEIGFEVTYRDDTKIKFIYKGNEITLFPYSGWFQGKGVKPGRGLNNLIDQIDIVFVGDNYYFKRSELKRFNEFHKKKP